MIRVLRVLGVTIGPELRNPRIVAILVLSAALLYLHGPTVHIGFLADDFAWNSIGKDTHSAAQLTDDLVAPRAQGTVRVLSERLFFYLPRLWLGDDTARTQRYLVLSALLLAVVLVFLECYRSTGSAVSSAAAVLLWICCPAVGSAVAWLSSFNQILCALLSLLVYRWLREGRVALCLLAFLAGLASHEAFTAFAPVVMYYGVFVDRRRLRLASGVMVLAVCFGVCWLLFWREPSAGVYRITLGRETIDLLSVYLQMTLGLRRSIDANANWGALGIGIAGVAVYLFYWAREKPLAGFFLVWWIVTLSPFLLLSGHPTNYYPAYPAIGLCLAVGALLGEGAGTRPRRLARWAAIIGVASLCWAGSAKVVTIRDWNRAQADRVKRLLAGIRQARINESDAIAVINTIDPLLFLFSLRHTPEAGFEGKLLLAPAVSDRLGTEVPDWLKTSDSDLSWRSRGGAVLLYDVGPDGTVKQVSRWTAQLPTFGPTKLRALAPEHDRFFGKGWFDREEGGRWMGRSSAATLGSPHGKSFQVAIHGWLPSQILERGSLILRVSVDGKPVCRKELATAEVTLACSSFLAIPNQKQVTVRLDFDREVQPPPDVRGLSFLLDFIELRDP